MDLVAASRLLNHYLVYVDYRPLPTREQLNGSLFDEEEYRLCTQWDPHESCKDLDESPKDLVFWLGHLKRGIESLDAAAKEAKAAGYRFATLKEGLAFVAKYPDMQRHLEIEVLGSYTSSDCVEWVPVFDACPEGRRLTMKCDGFAGFPDPGVRALLVLL